LTEVRERLQNLLALEKEGKIQEALAEAEVAMREFGDSVAFKAAACYLARRLSSGTQTS